MYVCMYVYIYIYIYICTHTSYITNSRTKQIIFLAPEAVETTICWAARDCGLLIS